MNRSQKIQLGMISFLCVCMIFAGSPYVELAYAQGEPSPTDENGRRGSISIQLLSGFVGGMLGYAAYEYYIFHGFCNRPLPPDVDVTELELTREQIREFCISWVRGSARGTVYPAFIFGGSSLGIAAMGLLSGAQGNYIAMTIGSLSGSFSGAAIWSRIVWNIIVYLSDAERIDELREDANTPPYWLRLASAIVAFIQTNIAEFEFNVKLFVPVAIAVLFGVIGFNIGI